jgi:hypothetical protein
MIIINFLNFLQHISLSLVVNVNNRWATLFPRLTINMDRHTLIDNNLSLKEYIISGNYDYIDEAFWLK